MKIKIMLVDDMEISNLIMKKIISVVTNKVDVFDCTDPCKAYDEMQLINPDLIFLDLNMPCLNGWEFLEKMQTENYTYKVIILTSSCSILDKERSAKFLNVIDYCEKPMSKESISSSINGLLENYKKLAVV